MIKKIEHVARLYAKALFELASDKNCVDDVRNDFSSLVQLMKDQEQLITSLSAFGFSTESRLELWKKISDKVQTHALLKRLVEILIIKSRLALIEQIFDAYVELVDVSKNILKGTVTTIAPLDEKDRQALSKAFSKKFNKQVELETTIDKQILGGLIVQVQGLTFDGSLRASIRNLRENLERRTV